MLQSIPDGMSKAMLWLEFQQKIIQVKYSGHQAVPSSNVLVAPHLHKAPQASANNYVGIMSPPSVPSPSENSVSSKPSYCLFCVLKDK